jgi:Xaa-Pro dipeptidase
VETLHTVLNRGCSIWDRSRLPEAEFRSRLERMRQGMKQRGVDLLLVYGDSWKYGHLAYLTHFIPKNRGALAVIPLTGEPALVIQEPSRNNPFSSTLTWIQEVHSVGKFAQGLTAALKSRALTPKRVGLVAVEEQLNIREWREFSELFEEIGSHGMGEHSTALRRVKSTPEIALITETTRILEEALARFEQIARPGRTEYELMAEMEREARRRGVEDFRLLLARSSTPTIGLRPAVHSAFAPGEAVLILVAASYQRYWSELGETFCFGQPSNDVARSHELAAQVFHGLLQNTKVGVTLPAASAYLNGVSSPAARESLAAYGLGNGVGLDLSEAPCLGTTPDGTLEPGSTVTLRACMTGQDTGCALTSRPYVATESGLQPLARRPCRLIPIGS